MHLCRIEIKEKSMQDLLYDLRSLKERKERLKERVNLAMRSDRVFRTKKQI